MTEVGGLRYQRYHVGNGAEWLMRIGIDDGPPVLFIPPLFEEMNRTRALIVGIMRALAGQGFGCWLLDLPGTGESERTLELCGWNDWLDAVAVVADRARSPQGQLIVASLRGGTLLDQRSDAAHWRFAPVEGSSLLRDFKRSKLVSGDGLAGYRPSDALTAGLAQATVQDLLPCRIARLTSDPKEADVKYDGPALWRRSEPADAPELAALLASDIEHWALKCGIC